MSDFPDMGEMWITQYNDYSDEWTPEGFKQEMQSLLDDIRPMYNKLYAYIRMKLRKQPEYENKLPKNGYLPVQILGNMWGQVGS